MYLPAASSGSATSSPETFPGFSVLVSSVVVGSSIPAFTTVLVEGSDWKDVSASQKLGA